MTDLLPVPANEKERLQALRDYNILDTAYEKEFDRLTQLAAVICGVPMSVITLIDYDRQWFKSKVGLDGDETTRDIAFCQYTIMGDTMLSVEDATQDERFKDNPQVTGDPYIRFYAGYPLIDPKGYALGTLCVIDDKPKRLNNDQEYALKVLAQEAISQIIARKEKQELQHYETLFNLSNDLICMTGADGYFKKINPFFEQTLGWTNNQLMGRQAIEFVYPEDIAYTREQLSLLNIGAKTVALNNRFTTANGSFRYLHWVVTKDPATSYSYAIARDITQQKLIEQELVETKNMLESANKIAKIGSWKANLETQEVHFSDLTKEIYEVEADFIPTFQNSILFSDPETREIIEKLIAHTLHTGEPFDTELRITTAEGNHKWTRAMGGVELKNGRPHIIYGTMQDIDREKRIRLEFNEIYTELKGIMDADSGILIITGDIHGKIKTFNKGAEKMLGYKPEEMIGIQHATVFHDPEEIKHYAEKISKELDIDLVVPGESLIAKARLGTTDTNEWTFITKDGSRITAELSLTALKNAENQITGYLGIAKDITAKRNSERLLQLSEERHRGFFEHSQGLMCTHDLKGKFFSVNPAGAELLGYSAEEYMQKTLFDLVPSEFSNRVQEYLDEIQREGQSKGLMLVQHRDGSIKTWMYNNILSELIDGEKYVIGNAVDITERIQNEKELVQAKIQAEKNAYAKDVFLANMSHEIRTPMNAIVGFANLLKDSPLSTEQSEYLSYIIISTENLLGIINDILDLSKIESGHIAIEEVPFSIKEILKTVRSIFQGKAAEKDLELFCSADDAIPDSVVGDPTRLNQILLNLTNNAVKFTTSGSVKIIAEQSSDSDTETTILFKVIDTGIGISQDKLEMIFDRFTQANSDTTRKYGGTGLGLSISKSLIELQNGRIWVESQPGKGSTFGFSITYKKIRSKTVKVSAIKASELVTDKKISILLVEDNILNQKLAIRVLEKFGFEADLAQNGKIAVEKVKSNRYNIILMDLQMPEMDGYQATTTIRDELKNDTPIIAMTAHSLVGEKEKCIEIGMNEYITKPFNQRELFEKIIRFA